MDDEPDLGEIFSEALTASGAAVRIFTNGSTAIESFRKERADLVFCDLKLPGLDGFEVLTALKSIDPWVTVIIMSVYDSPESVARAFKLGAYGYLEKPCSLTQIQQLTSQAMDHRRKLREMTVLQGRPGTARDVPSRLVELEQVKSDFFELIMQDLRKPLKLLSEELSLAHRGFYGSWSEAHQKFLNNCSKVHALLSRMLSSSFAALKDKHPVALVQADVREILKSALKTAVAECGEKGLRVTVRLPAQPLIGMTDAEKVGRIIWELLDNAVTLTRPQGAVEVTLESRGSGFQFRIKDQAGGISEEDRSWIFSTFRLSQPKQPEPWKKRHFGLALVQHDLNLLGGTLELKSQMGAGSEFLVTIPWANA